MPFWSVVPTSSNGSKNSPRWFSEPLNIRCSNRCAKPVRPAGSSLLPTWYQMLTATIGALRSVCTTTRRPLGSVNSSYGMSTVALGAACTAVGAKAVPPMAVARAMARAAARGRKEAVIETLLIG